MTGDGPPGPEAGDEVSMAQPTWPPQSVIVARRPSRRSCVSHRRRMMRLEDFGDRTLTAAISPARTTPLVSSTGPFSSVHDGPNTPQPAPPSTRIIKSSRPRQGFMSQKVQIADRSAHEGPVDVNGDAGGGVDPVL